MKSNLKTGFLVLFVLCSMHGFAQDEDPDQENNVTVSKASLEGFHIGFFAGAYFANKYTASVYDGYGENFSGVRNDFAHSYMNQKINVETDYNLANSQQDFIGQEVGVSNREEWHFTEGDMPVNVKYNPAFLFGLQANYGLTKKDALLLNMNFAKLSVTGTFTITTTKPANSNQYVDTVHYFGLQGGEQRLLFQLGYQRIITNGEQINIFVEGGFSLNYASFQSNTIEIGRTIDLTSSFDQLGYFYYKPKNYAGWGFGGFGGLGVTLGMSSKYIMQLVYQPSYESINLGPVTSPKLQQTVGLRAYFNL